MKILFVVNQLGVGGVQRKAALLAAGLLERGHQVDVATFFGGETFAEPILRAGGRVLSDLEGTHYGSYSLPARVWNALRRLRKLERLIGAGDHDIVYGLGATPGMYCTAAGRLHRSTVVWGIELVPAPNVRLPLHFNLLARLTDLIIAVSEDAREACIKRGLPAKRIVVIENGADIERFYIDPGWRREVRTELGLDHESPLIGAIGRITPVKNLELFLQACRTIAAKNDRARFLVVGPGPSGYVEQLQQAALSLGIGGRISWVGSRKDVERYYNAIDVFVSSSANEGLPLTRLEAMACGIPCVVTDVGDAERTIGAFGSVVPVDDPEALASAILRVVQQEWSREAIRAAVVDRFSAERQVERTEAALQELLE
jgi:glycosyltransferase involved in cell wall biosynthesis